MACFKGSAQGRLLRLFVFTVPLTQWKLLRFFVAGVTEDWNPWRFFDDLYFSPTAYWYPEYVCKVPYEASASLVFVNPSTHNQWRLGGGNAPICACQVLTVWTSYGQLKPCQWLISYEVMILKIWCFCFVKLQDTCIRCHRLQGILVCQHVTGISQCQWKPISISQMFAQLPHDACRKKYGHLADSAVG